MRRKGTGLDRHHFENHPPDPDRERVPATNRSVPRWVSIGLFVYASILFVSLAKDFLVPVLLAFLLALVLTPIRRFFDERGLPPALTSIVLVGALLAALSVVIGAIIVPVSGYIESLPRIEEDIHSKLAGISEALSSILEASRRLSDALKSHAADVEQVELRGNGLVTSAALVIPGLMAQALFTVVLLLFLLASGDMFYEKIIEIMPTVQDKQRAVQITHDIERKLSRYLLTIMIINLGLGFAVATLLWAMNMPNPLVFGVIAFVCNFVPYLGPLVSLVAATAVALVSSSGVGLAVAVGLAYLCLTTIEGQIITPYFVGRRLRLNTVVVFIAVSFWAWLWSAIGMLVAVPLLVTISVFCEHVDGLRGLGKLLSERKSDDHP